MKNLINLENKTILVTGASSGIGRATAILLSQLGAKLFLTGRDITKLELTRNQLTNNHHIVVPFDFSDCSKLNEWVENFHNKTYPAANL